MIRFGEPTASACVYVAKHMRVRDVLEIGAVCPDFNPVDIGVYAFESWRKLGAAGLVSYVDDRPVSIMTLNYETPSSLQAMMYATDDFEKIGNQVTRYMLKRIKPELIDRGIRRIEARCWEKHVQAMRWMRALGAKQEAVIQGYGVNGETFIQMAWSNV